MRVTVFTLFVVACALVSVQAANSTAAEAPPPLTGEALGNNGSAGSASGHCNPAAASPFTWDVSGAATGFFDLPGPYPGQFHQSGFAVVGSFVPTGGEPTAPLQAYGSQFEIDSPVGEVRGIITFTRDSSNGTSFGECSPDTGFLGAVAQFHYRALIRSNGWLCLTTGNGAQAVNTLPGSSASVDVAFETTDAFDCHPLP